MSEFNNRINAQRDALKIVNRTDIFKEPLLSLTEKAIDRWARNNQFAPEHAILVLLKAMSGTLFFLANKSQEQVTDDYKVLSSKVSKQLYDLEQKVSQMESL